MSAFDDNNRRRSILARMAGNIAGGMASGGFAEAVHNVGTQRDIAETAVSIAEQILQTLERKYP